MSSSYLGITPYFSSNEDHKCHRPTLAVIKMGHPYSTERIVEIFEDEWSINSRKVKAIVTDNDSNAVDEFDQANSEFLRGG